jgi:hypothetical protein
MPVNCVSWQDGELCKRGLLDDVKTPLGICDKCAHREAVDGAMPVFVHVSLPTIKPRRTRSLPGDYVKRVLEKLGFANSTNCGCAAFRKQMNDWGWTGCLTVHRDEVVEWFVTKAKSAGVVVDADLIWAACKAVWSVS